MDIRMNKEFKMKLTPNDDKTVYSQNLPMHVKIKADLIVDFVLMHKLRTITLLSFSTYANQIFGKRKLTEKYGYVWISGKLNVWLQMALRITATH